MDSTSTIVHLKGEEFYLINKKALDEKFEADAQDAFMKDNLVLEEYIDTFHRQLNQH